MKPYSPTRDALWLFSVALFVLNKVWIKPNFSGVFWHSFLNDVLCLPVWMPIMVWLFARLRLRNDASPRPLEIVISWLFWSVVFEVVMPNTTTFGSFSAGDPMDVFAYGFGGIVGFAWWEHLRRKKSQANMTKSPFLLTLLLFSSLAQADVASVRRKVASIDSMKLTAKSHDRNDLSSEGAQISVWRDSKGDPRKIVAHVFGEMGRKHDTIYLEKGQPLFLFTVDESYNGPLSVSVKVAKRTETRLYFDNGKLFLKREGTKTIPLTPAQKQAGNKSTREAIQLYLSRGK